ncbi:MAG: hypothetical protein R3C59_13605 [Planctomycetaceae bacterium]
MSKLLLLVLLSVNVMLTGKCFGQEPNAVRGRVVEDKGKSLSAALTLGDMMQSATELRLAADSLARFGESMVKVSAVAERSVVSASQNLAAMGGEFDPFGFKTAFQTIQQQNEIIQAQYQMIVTLQQQEIDRLREQLKQQPQVKQRNETQQSRRGKSGRSAAKKRSKAAKSKNADSGAK